MAYPKLNIFKSKESSGGTGITDLLYNRSSRFVKQEQMSGEDCINRWSSLASQQLPQWGKKIFTVVTAANTTLCTYSTGMEGKIT